MSRIERSITIAADPRVVWATVADLESVHVWNPNVASAECGVVTEGVGATRACVLSTKGRIDEVVSKWQPGRELWFAIGSHGAIRSADMGIVLSAVDGGTEATAVTDYHLVFGPLGPVVDRLTMRRAMARMMDASLSGLKEHVEATETKEGTNS